jgi:hypothetical protein
MEIHVGLIERCNLHRLQISRVADAVEQAFAASGHGSSAAYGEWHAFRAGSVAWLVAVWHSVREM